MKFIIKKIAEVELTQKELYSLLRALQLAKSRAVNPEYEDGLIQEARDLVEKLLEAMKD